MSRPIFCIPIFFVLALCMMGATAQDPGGIAPPGPAPAPQGVVTFTKDYPKGTKDTPAALATGVWVKGSYTTAAGWIATGANFTWTGPMGGTPAGVPIDYLNNAQNTGGGVGLLENGAIVVKFVELLPGNYQGWLTIAYTPNPNPNNAAPTLVISFFFFGAFTVS